MAFINPYADAGISKDDVLTVGINGQDPVTVASKEREECAEALGGTFRTDFYKDANGGEHFYDKDSGLSEWEWIENKQKEVGHLTRAGADERPSNYIYTYKTYDLGGELGQVRVREDEQKDFEASVSAQGLQPREVSTQRWNGVDVSGYSEQLEDVFSRFSKNGRLTDDQMLVMGATEEAIAAGKENMQHRIDKIDESLRAKGEIGFLEHEATTRGLNTIGRQADSIGDKIAMYGTEAVDAVTLDLYWTPGEMAKHFGGEDGLEKIKNMDWIDTMRIAFMSGESIFDIKSNPEAFHARMQEMNNNIHAQDHVVGVRGLTTGARVGSSAIDMAKAGLEFATTAYLAAHAGYFAPVAAPIIYAAGHLPDAYNEQIADRVFFNPATGQIEKVADGRKGGEALAYAVGGVALDYLIEQYGGKIAGAALKPITKPMKSFATRILGKEMSTVLGLTPGIVKNWKGGGVIKKSAMKMSQAYHSLARNPWGKVVQSGIRGATPSGILEELNEEALQAFAEGALNIRGELDLERGRIADGSMLEGLRGVVDVYKNAPEFAATLVLYNIGAGPVSRGVNRAVSTYGNASTLRQALQLRGYTKEQLKGMSRQDIQSAFRKEYMTGSPEAQAKVEAEMLERHKTAEGMLTELQNHEMPQGTELLQLEDGSYNVKITDNEGNETVLTDQEEIRTWAAARLGDVAGKFGYNAFLTQEQMQKVSNAIMFMSREELDNVSRLLRETGVNKAFEVFGNDPDMVDAMQQALSMQYLANSKMYANTPMGQVFRIKSDAMFREMARREALQDADAVDAAFGEFYRYANGIAVEGEQISKDDIKPIFTPEELRTGGTVRDGGAKTWEKNGILLTQLQDGTFRVRLEDAAHRTATRSFASQGEALEYLNSLGAKKAKSDERFNALKLQAEQIYDSLYNNGQGGQRNMLVLHNAYENSAITKDLYKHYERSRYFGRMSFDEFVASVPAIRAPNGGLVLFTDNITTLSGLTSAIRHEGMHTGLQQMFDLDGKTGDAGVKAFIERVLPIFENAGDKFVLRDAVGDEVDLRNFDKYGPATQAYMLDEAMAYLCEIVSVNPSLGEKVNSIFSDTLFKGNKALSGMTTAQRNREVRTLIAESFARVHNPERGAALRRWHEMAGAADLRQYGVPEEVNTTYAVPRGSSGDIERRGYRGIKLPPPSNDTDTETTLQERVKNKKKRKQEVRKQAEQVVEERIEKERENLRKPKRKKRGKAEAVKPDATEVKQTAVQGEVVDAPVKEKKAEQKPTQEVITVTAPQPVEEYKERVTEFVNNAKDKRLAKAVVCEELLDAVRAYEALAGEMDGDLAAEIHARKLFLEEVLKRLNDDNVAAETPVNALPPAEAKPAETTPVAPKAEEGTTPTEEKPSSTTPKETPKPEDTESDAERINKQFQQNKDAVDRPIIQYSVYTALRGMQFIPGKSMSDQEARDASNAVYKSGIVKEYSNKTFEGRKEGFTKTFEYNGKTYFMRAFTAKKWDFVNRDAIYIAIASTDSSEAGNIDAEKLYGTPFFNTADKARIQSANGSANINEGKVFITEDKGFAPSDVMAAKPVEAVKETTPTEDNPVPETTETVQQRAESAKKVLVEEVVGKHSRRQKVFDEATARWLEFNPADGKTIGDLTEDETFSLLVDLYIRNTLGSDNRVLSDESFLALADKSGLELATVLNEINKLYTACEEAKVFKKNNASKKTVSRAKQWGLDTETLIKVGEKELPKLRESFGNNTLISLNDVTPRDFATAIASFRARSESHFEPLTLKIGALSNNQSSMLASRILYGLWDRQFDKLSKTANATRKRHENKLAINKDILRLLKASKIDLTFEFDNRYASGIATMLEAINADAKSDPKLFVPTALSEWRKFVHDIPNTALDAIADIKVDKSRVDKLVMNLDYAANGGRRYSMKTIKDLEESLLYAILNGCHQFQRLKQEVGVINSTIEGLYDLNSAGSRQDIAVNQVYSRMQFIGERGATKKEKDGLKVAKQMLRDYGYTAKRLIDSRDTDTIIDINEELFNETGWFVGLDGKWRFETDYIEDIFEDWDDADRLIQLKRKKYDFKLDGDAKRGLAAGQTENVPFMGLTNEEQAEFDALEKKLATPISLYSLCKNKDLFKRYPALKDVKISFVREGNAAKKGAFYDATRTITLNVENLKTPYETLAHELQHAIQSIEGFAKGSNPGQMSEALGAAWTLSIGRNLSPRDEKLSNKNTSERIAATLMRLVDEAAGMLDAGDAYALVSGEIEAREAGSRVRMSPEERARETPGYFYGVDQRYTSAYQDAITFFSNDEIDTLVNEANNSEPVDFGDFSIDMQSSPDFSARVSLLESAARGEKPEQLKDVPPSNIMLQISSEKRGGFVARGNVVESTLQNIDTRTKKYEYNGEMLSLEELGIKAKSDDAAKAAQERVLQGFKTGVTTGDNTVSIPYAGMLVDENAPSILARLVHKDAKTVVRYSTVAKILDRLSGWAFGSTNSHNVPREAFDEFLYELDNPIAVYEKEGAFCFVTNMSENRKAPGKNRVVIIIRPMMEVNAKYPLFVVGVDGQVSNVKDDGLYYELKTAFAPDGELGAHVDAIRENLLYVNTERLDGIEFDSRNGVDKKSLPASDILHEVIANIGNAKNTQSLFKNDAKWDPNKVYNKAVREADAKAEEAKTKAKQFKLPERSNVVGEIGNTLNTLIENGLKENGDGEDLWTEVALGLVEAADKLPESAAEISAELNAFAESPAFDVDSAKKVLDVVKQYDYNSLAARALVSAKVKKLGADGVEITPSSLLKAINAHQALKAGSLEIKKSQLGHVKAIAQEIADLAFKQNAAASDIRIQFATPIRTDEQFMKYQNRVLAASEALRNFGERSYDKVINAQGPLFRGVNKVLSTLGIKKEEVGDDLNVEASVKNVHGKIRNKVEQIHRQYLDPLRQLMKNHKLDAETLDEYLYAKFAPERNKMIQARTLVVDPNTGELISMDENGSGMSAEEAATINKRFMSDPKREAYDKAMHLVWEMNAKASEMMVKYGLVSNAQREMWRKLSPHYVPLLDLDANHFSRSMKKNLHLNGIPRRAKGRYTKAASPLAGSVYQMQEIIKRGERSNVNKTLAAFIQKYDAEGKVMGGRVLDFAGVTKTVGKGDPMFVPNGSVAESIIRDYNQQENVKATGQEIELVETEDSKELGGKLVASGGIPETLRVKLTSSTAGAPNVVEYFEGGNRKFILFDKHNEEAVRIAEAANGTNILVPGAASSLEAPWRLTQRLTRWKADISTTLNPKFVLRNMGADFFNTSMILMTEGKYKELGSFAKNYFAAMKTVRDFAKGKQIGDSELGKYYLEARENGMLTGVYGEGTFKEAAHKLSRDIKRMQGGSLRQGWEGFKEFMETIGSYPEQGARLAVYAAMRKRGMSPAQAAQYGREVTVDFNAKGEWTPVINTLYMFSNAGAQGVARAVKALQTGAADRGGGVQGYVRAAMPGIMVSLALGYLSSMMMDATGDDDEEDGVNTSKYARLPEHVKSNNVAIPFVGDTYIQLPTRGMWQSFTNLGTLIYDFQTGRKDAEEVVAGFTASMRDATDFIGGNAPTAGQWLAPTIFDPLVQVLEGKDWAGREIYRKDFGQGGANAHRGKNATGSLYKMLAEGLNSATGGDKVKSGLIDIYPETYQLFTEFMLGSLAQLALNDVPNTLQTVAGAREAKANDLPAIGGVLRQSSDVESQYYTEFAKFDKVYKELKGYRKERMTAKTAEERQKWRDREQALIAKYPWARSADTLNAIASRITKLKKQTNERNEASIDAQIETQAKNFLRFIQKGE